MLFVEAFADEHGNNAVKNEQSQYEWSQRHLYADSSPQFKTSENKVMKSCVGVDWMAFRHEGQIFATGLIKNVSDSKIEGILPVVRFFDIEGGHVINGSMSPQRQIVLDPNGVDGFTIMMADQANCVKADLALFADNGSLMETMDMVLSNDLNTFFPAEH